MKTRRRRRRGFTLIELLVVISIIGILVGLLLPAVNQAREAGRRVQCQSNLHNVVMAILGYVNRTNQFPAAGTFCEATTVNPADPTTSGINACMPTASTVGGNPTSVVVPMYSWVVPILPDLDNQELYNQWSMWSTAGAIPYYDGYITGSTIATLAPSQASNWKIGSTNIGVLRCPDDNTIQTSQGNLSYAVNGGFSLWPAIPYGWLGTLADGSPGATVGAAAIGSVGAPGLLWGLGGTNPGPLLNVGISQKMGVMFLESTYPQGTTNVTIGSTIVPARIQFNARSTLTGITDGASSTILMSENTLTGVSNGSPYSFGLETNWAAPWPSFAMFIGSSGVCGVPTSNACATYLQPPMTDADGVGWAMANKAGVPYENINGGQNLTIEGSYPFSNSSHPGGCNMGFCDGAVHFITNTIDGTVYAKIITPAGSKLPYWLKQQPVSQDAFAP